MLIADLAERKGAFELAVEFTALPEDARAFLVKVGQRPSET